MAVIDRRKFIRRGAAAPALLALTKVGCREPGAASDDLTRPESASPSVLPFELEELAIQELREGIETGRFSCRKICEMYLERIEALNHQGPRLYAVLETNPQALEIAVSLDEELREKGHGPLFMAFLSSSRTTSTPPTK